MLTIKHIQVADHAVTKLLAALQSAIDWLGDKQEAAVVDAAYKVAENKTVCIHKAEQKIESIEDKQAELQAYAAEAKEILRAKYRAALDALDAELWVKNDKVNAELAAAAEAYVAATKDYAATVDEIKDKLGVWVDV